VNAYHSEDTSDGLKCVIQATIGHLNQNLLDRLLTVIGVHALSCSKLFSYTTQQPVISQFLE